MSCFERDRNEFVDTLHNQVLPNMQKVNCIEPVIKSPGSPTTKPTRASHLLSDTPVQAVSKRPHCRPHITPQADELNDLLEEALTTTKCNGRWIKNPLKSLAPSPVYSPNGIKFHHLSTSNYEKAREIDMNFAEIDMETFNAKDIDMAVRLAHSSPINDSMIRLCGDTEASCILMNSMYYLMDRSKESLFKDEMLFSRAGDVDSLSEKTTPKSCLMNLSTPLSDSFENSEDENKELVNKCNTTDKTQYTIAFDSNESRYCHNMVSSSNFDYLTSSIYNCAKNRVKLGDNGNTESPQRNDTVTATTDSDDTLSYHTLSSQSAHSTLNAHANSNFHEGNGFLPIYDLKASSISPDMNSSAGGKSRSHRDSDSLSHQKCEREENRHNNLKSHSSKQCRDNSKRPLGNLNLHALPDSTPMNQAPRTASSIISPCSLLPPLTSHDMHQPQVLTLTPHLQHLYENRLKHASPIREEDEPSTDSSRADVDMVSDSEKGTPPSTSDSSPLAPHGKSSTFNATAATTSRSGPWSSTQSRPGSEFSSDAFTNRSETNRNSNLRMSSGFTSGNSRQPTGGLINSNDLPRQNMAEWLKKTSMMSSPRGYYRPGGSEPHTPVTGVAGTMHPGHMANADYHHQVHHMAPMRSPSSANYCISHHQAHQLPEGRCCYSGASENGPHHTMRRPHVDNGGSEQVSPCKDTIYVCYPNYSLPDLSFLKSPNANTPVGDVCLSPTKPLVRIPVDKCSRGSLVSNTSSAGTLKNSPASATRPKSLNDVAALTKSAIAKVKDWDSISFLLSPEVKAILGAKGLVPPSIKSPLEGKKSHSSSTSGAFSGSAAVHPVKLRGRSTALAANKSKRYSLQEPVQSMNKSPAFARPSNRIGLVRSETLPTQDAGYFGGISHSRLTHPSCMINGSHNLCCHHFSPPSCCHHRAFALCCDSPRHRQSLINREDYIDTLKELLMLQDAEREVGQLLGALSPSLERKISLAQSALVRDTESPKNAKSKACATARPSAMILKSPGESKPIVPPKPTSLGASPSKFKSFIPVPKSPAPKCSAVASRASPSTPPTPHVPPKAAVKTSKPFKSHKKLSK